MKFAGLLVALLCLCGCATHVYPPTAPPHATTIYLCDYGIHSSLLLPSGGGQFVEYVYGDWYYAALNETDPLHTIMALFGSFQPALGRRFLRPDPGQTVPMPPNKPRTITPILVDAQKVHDVVTAMDARYRSHINTALINDYPDYYFMFVKDNEHYSALNNCNRLTARNLGKMGCEPRGVPILSNFIVMPLGASQSPPPGEIKPGRPKSP